jgi:hypothetical protein
MRGANRHRCSSCTMQQRGDLVHCSTQRVTVVPESQLMQYWLQHLQYHGLIDTITGISTPKLKLKLITQHKRKGLVYFILQFIIPQHKRKGLSIRIIIMQYHYTLLLCNHRYEHFIWTHLDIAQLV